MLEDLVISGILAELELSDIETSRFLIYKTTMIFLIETGIFNYTDFNYNNLNHKSQENYLYFQHFLPAFKTAPTIPAILPNFAGRMGVFPVKESATLSATFLSNSFQ